MPPTVQPRLPPVRSNDAPLATMMSFVKLPPLVTVKVPAVTDRSPASDRLWIVGDADDVTVTPAPIVTSSVAPGTPTGDQFPATLKSPLPAAHVYAVGTVRSS